MLDLTEQEWRALQIVVLRTDVRKEQFGGVHHLNWKKVGLSRAYFKKELLSAESMPTPRAAAAFDYLMKTYYVWPQEIQEEHKKKHKEPLPDIQSFYCMFYEMHKKRLEQKRSLCLSVVVEQLFVRLLLRLPHASPLPPSKLSRLRTCC